MANPGWYITSVGSMVVLPMQARFESPLRTIEQTGVYHETYRGESTNYPLVFRRRLRPIFHVSSSQLDAYKTLYETVSNTAQFYWVPDSSASGTAIRVKLVSPHFDPQPIQPGSYSGSILQRYSITLDMIEQLDPVEILA